MKTSAGCKQTRKQTPAARLKQTGRREPARARRDGHAASPRFHTSAGAAQRCARARHYVGRHRRTATRARRTCPSPESTTTTSAAARPNAYIRSTGAKNPRCLQRVRALAAPLPSDAGALDPRHCIRRATRRHTCGGGACPKTRPQRVLGAHEPRGGPQCGGSVPRQARLVVVAEEVDEQQPGQHQVAEPGRPVDRVRGVPPASRRCAAWGLTRVGRSPRR